MLDIALYLLNNILELYFQECILDYDKMSVICAVCARYFTKKDAETAYKEYIDGSKSFLEVSAYYEVGVKNSF